VLIVTLFTTTTKEVNLTLEADGTSNRELVLSHDGIFWPDIIKMFLDLHAAFEGFEISSSNSRWNTSLRVIRGHCCDDHDNLKQIDHPCHFDGELLVHPR